MQVDAIKSLYANFQELYVYNGLNDDTLQPIRLSDSSLGKDVAIADLLSSFPRSRGIWQVKIAIETWTIEEDKKTRSRKGKGNKAKSRADRGARLGDRLTGKPTPLTVYEQKRKARYDETDDDTSLPSPSTWFEQDHKRRKLHTESPSAHQISPLNAAEQKDRENDLLNDFLASMPQSPSPVPQSPLAETHNNQSAAHESIETRHKIKAETTAEEVGAEKTVIHGKEEPVRVTRARARQSGD